MLLGYYQTSLDGKGRIAVPKRFRDGLPSDLVVGRFYEGCLVVIEKSLWKDLAGQLTGGELAPLGARDTDRFLLAGSFEIELDRQGRFVVPLVLRSYAGLKDEIICAGLGDRFEIWDKKVWEEREKLLIEEAGEKVEKLYRERGRGRDES